MQAFVFDLDGTLVDSVYQHVLAWQNALDEVGMELSVWLIHRKVGMSGGLFANALLRETGREVTTREAERLSRLHTEAFARRIDQVRPLPGAVELLAFLTELEVPWAIATSGGRATATRTIALLEVPDSGPDRHPRRGVAGQAGPGPLPRRGRATGQEPGGRRRGGRQRLGPPGSPPGPKPGGRCSVRGLRPRGAGTS